MDRFELAVVQQQWNEYFCTAYLSRITHIFVLL